MSMDEHAFDRVADVMLHRLEKSLGDLDPDVCDVNLSMGVMTLEFADKGRYIVNSHRAARQIWLAAELKAWHFSYHPEPERWVDERSGDELIGVLEKLVTQKLNTPVRI
ncbi:MAG: iron donor protein CyaY [Myxococcota bacterium]